MKRSATEAWDEAEARIQDALGRQDPALDLTGLALGALPDSVRSLTHLQALHVDGLRSLPDWIGELGHLRSLEVINGDVDTLPESLGSLSKLKSLKFFRNKLTTVPESIGHLRQLETLNLGENPLGTVPPAVCQLPNLRRLFIWQTGLDSLPDAIENLRQLEHLSVTDNRLRTLPDALGKLSALRWLEVSGNKLSSLPQSLTNLRRLKALYLHGNPDLGIPPEVLGPTLSETRTSKPSHPTAILRYFFRVCSGARPLNEAKLILIGRGGVGKTSLVNRMLHNKFNRGEPKTDGIQITPWNLCLGEDEWVRLNVWDFGGQEIMHATHQFFLSQRSLYLLVLSGRQGGEDLDAEYWLKLISSFGGDSPVIVVLNKIKEHPFDLNRRGLCQKYPSIRDFITTDCADSVGLDALRSAIERETDALGHLRVSFPASWFSIKEILAAMKENYLTFDRYRQLCADQGEADSSAQESLAGYLHSLGIALNYADDPRLRDKHVLNPHWVTSGIYKILNAPLLAKQRGELSIADLPKILPADDYPIEMHGFLLDLMRKFELCFGFPDHENVYLVPELLDKQEPDLGGKFRPEECLNFQYLYPILPEGLLPRFIVKTHVLSDAGTRWRSGTVLRFEGNEALVKAEIQERRVTISVTGPIEGRRRLLAVIRSDLERIHHSIERLLPQEIVPAPGRPEILIPYHKLRVLEEKGIATLAEVSGDDVVDIDVQDLLNGIEIDRARIGDRSRPEHQPPLSLVYCYSHKDEHLRDQLETHLKLLQRARLIDSWHDRRIDPGDDWKKMADEQMARAHIILLLVSADFIASDYCYDGEMNAALTRHDRGDAVVIPVLVRDVSYAEAPFAKLEVLPRNRVPVTLWQDRDSAWRSVADEIKNVVEAAWKKRTSRRNQ